MVLNNFEMFTRTQCNTNPSSQPSGRGEMSYGGEGSWKGMGTTAIESSCIRKGKIWKVVGEGMLFSSESCSGGDGDSSGCDSSGLVGRLIKFFSYYSKKVYKLLQLRKNAFQHIFSHCPNLSILST